MILSNVSIHRAGSTTSGSSSSPEPLPRRKEGNAQCPYQTTAVDLRLGNEIAYFKAGLPVSIDLARGSFADLLARIR